MATKDGITIPDWVVPPPEGSINTQAIVTLTNPVTGETFNAPNGGYTVNPALSGVTDTVFPGSPPEAVTTPSTVPATTQQATTTDLTNLPAYSTDVSGAQQIVSGNPQTADEVNIVDYYGTMADRPVLQPETQLAPQVQKQVVQAGEIQGQVPLPSQVPMATAGIATAQQVATPTISPTVTATATEAETVSKPSVTKTEAIQTYETVSEAADAFSAAQLELENVDPRATVQGQLAELQKQFEGGQTPIWAQGAMRQASALMAQRGVGSSTMAAEAITNALMQSTIPIAQQDASFYQSVTMQNLVNEQEVEITKFNARLSSIFNDQAAENTARNINAQTENDTARFFTELSQNVVMANTAAVNAMDQFNANAMNQMNQFASEMGLQADTINAQMANDMAQFNGEQLLNVSKFNASMKDAREKFNVQNQIAIDANNIQWRRTVNTANTAATNAAIQTDVQNLLGLQQSGLNNIWNHYDTLLNMAFQTEENAKDRAANVAIATLDAEARKQLAEDGANSSLIGDIFEGAVTILGSDTAWSRITGWLQVYKGYT